MHAHAGSSRVRGGEILQLHPLSPMATTTTKRLSPNTTALSREGESVVSGLGLGRRNSVSASAETGHGSGNLIENGAGAGSGSGKAAVAGTNGTNGRKRSGTITGRSTSPTSSRKPSSTSSTTVPAKRKQPPSPSGSINALPGPSSPLLDASDPDTIRCICGYTTDDGWSIGCDGCSRWVHGVCFGIEMKDKERLPERWWCWECDVGNPNFGKGYFDRLWGEGGLEKARERAREIQGRRLAGADARNIGKKRMSSPGVERSKSRKPSSLAIQPPDSHTNKRKRTANGNGPSPLTTTATTPLTSFPFPLPSSSSHLHPNGHSSNSYQHSGKPNSSGKQSNNTHSNHFNSISGSEEVDIDDFSMDLPSYVDLTQTHDIIPHAETREHLRRQAAEWRGISAISQPLPSTNLATTPVYLPAQHGVPTPVSLRPLPMGSSASHPSSILPPTFSVHTTHHIPSHALLTPFPSVITPSSEYLKDPLNGYSVLGMPKPRVHLVGPPLDVCLDARGGPSYSKSHVGEREKGGPGKAGAAGTSGADAKGNGAGAPFGRFVRSGCRPNAVLRPVLCDRRPTSTSTSSSRQSKESEKGTRKENHRDMGKARESEDDQDETTLSFAIFALRDLKEGEEVVLGWEWDDANIVHLLPALLEGRGVFPPSQLHSYKLQMSNILRALSATFATCACGESTTEPDEDLDLGSSGAANGNGSFGEKSPGGVGTEGLGSAVGFDQRRGKRLGGCVIRRMKEFVEGVYDCDDAEREKSRQPWSGPSILGSEELLPGSKEVSRQRERDREQDRRDDDDEDMLVPRYRGLRGNNNVFSDSDTSKAMAKVVQEDVKMSNPEAPTPAVAAAPASSSLDFILNRVDERRPLSSTGALPSSSTHGDSISRSNTKHPRSMSAHYPHRRSFSQIHHQTQPPLPPHHPNLVHPDALSTTVMPTLNGNSAAPTQLEHDLGPLIGIPRGFRTRERIPGSGGWGGAEMDVDVNADGSLQPSVGPRAVPSRPSPSLYMDAPTVVPIPSLANWGSRGRELFSSPPSSHGYGYPHPQFPHLYTHLQPSHAPFIPTLIHPHPHLIPYSNSYQYGSSYTQSHSYGITSSSHLKRHQAEWVWEREIQHAQDDRDKDDKESLYWGWASRRDGKEKRDIDKQREEDMEGDVDIEATGTEDDEDGLGLDHQTQPKPQRHRRKRSLNPHRRLKFAVEGTNRKEVEIGLENVEVPPKMKRRFMHLKKELDGDLEVDNEPNNRNGDKDNVSVLVTPDPIPVLPLSVSTAMSTVPQISIDILPPHPTMTSNTDPRTRLHTETDAASANSNSSASPLMSLANLSLLSPAIPLSGSTLMGRELGLELMTKDLWSESHSPPPSTSLGNTSSPREPLKSPISRTVPTDKARRSVVADPLAALAAAAAAARPISPLSKRGQIRDEWDYEKGQERERDRELGSTSSRSRSPVSKAHPPLNLKNSIISPPAFSRRPISPTWNDITRHTHEHQRQYRSQSRESSSTQAHDAVLGPGGIRVLSSPQYVWAPLRKSSVSSVSVAVFDDVPSETSIDRDVVLEGVERVEPSGSAPGSVHSPFSDNGDESTSLEVKLEMVEGAECWFGEDSHHVNAHLDEGEANVVDLVSSPIRGSMRVNDAHLTQFDDVDKKRNSPLPFQKRDRLHSHSPTSLSHSNSNSVSPAEWYITPLSPPSDPPQNLDEIPPWPASPSPSLSISASVYGSPKSKPRSTARSARDRSLSRASAVIPSPVNETFSLPMPSSMTALSSAGSSPALPSKGKVAVNKKEIAAAGDVTVTKKGVILSSSPLSSPLSSPMENLISLPAHSAPPAAMPSSPEDRMEMEIDEPKADDAQPRPTTPSEVPALDHSNSVSPYLGNISPTTPPEQHVESEAGRSTELINSDEGVVVFQEDRYEAKGQQEPSLALASGNVVQVPASSVPSVEGNDQFMKEHLDASASLGVTTTAHTRQTPTTSLSTAPSTPIPAPFKVKISLKDFALRKRRQKEEEQQREKEEREQEEQKEVSKEVSEQGNAEFGHQMECPEVANGTEITKYALENETMLPVIPIPLHTLSVEWEAEDCERKQPQSDVDVILKASETLNKLMVTSKAATTSKMVNGNTEHLSMSSSPSLSHATVLNAFPNILSRAPIANPSSAPPIRLSLSPSANYLAPPSLSQIATETSPRAASRFKHTRRSSHEDGEIVDTDDQVSFSSPAPPSLPPDTKPPLGPLLSSIPKSYSPPPRAFKFSDTTNTTSEQRSRTPPTQPRSFVSHSPLVSSLPHGSPPLRNMGLSGNTSILPLTSISAASSAAAPAPTTAPPAAVVSSVNPALGRTPPSGPRALRQLQQRHDTGGRGFVGDRGGFISRGPGTPYDPRDRDRFRDRGARDRDRDRDWDRDWNNHTPRIRARDSGWGR